MATYKKVGGCGCKGVCGCGCTPKAAAAHPASREVLMVPEDAWSDEPLGILQGLPTVTGGNENSHYPPVGGNHGDSVTLADAGAPIPGARSR